MNSIYEIIMLGKSNLIDDLQKSISKQFDNCGLDNYVGHNYIYNRNDKKSKNLSICLYFMSAKENYCQDEEGQLEKILNDGIPVIPIYDNKLESLYIPTCIREINYMSLYCSDAYETQAMLIEKIAIRALELLGILSPFKSIFISYKRKDSQAIATQLYEELTTLKYNVFLDTHSLDGGIRFQEHLFDTLSYSNIGILLDSEHILENDTPYVAEEIARMEHMGCGVLQIIWPNKAQTILNTLAEKYQLVENNLIKEVGGERKLLLDDRSLKGIIAQIESLRIRSLNAMRNRVLGVIDDYDFSEMTKDIIFDTLVYFNDSVYHFIFPTRPKTNTVYRLINKLDTKAVGSNTYNIYCDTVGMHIENINYLNWLMTYLPVHLNCITSK